MDDGKDVLIFVMSVYEFAKTCPESTKDIVYINFLDSVAYLQPKRYRTAVYQEMLVAYLESAKGRGFYSAYIWACPPKQGQDYVLYRHPDDQFMPTQNRLQAWWGRLL
ncbi:unnamed protein product, partial [Ectocarpus fasciculatus]